MHVGVMTYSLLCTLSDQIKNGFKEAKLCAGLKGAKTEQSSMYLFVRKKMHLPFPLIK